MAQAAVLTAHQRTRPHLDGAYGRQEPGTILKPWNQGLQKDVGASQARQQMFTHVNHCQTRHRRLICEHCSALHLSHGHIGLLCG